MPKAILYQHHRNCKLITEFGEVDLDEDGFVTNLADFDEAEQKSLLGLDGFVDADVFGGGPRRRPLPQEGTTTQPKVAQTTDQEYWQVIKDLTARGTALTSEGYIQMEPFTAKLRELGMPPISGTKRIRITDEAHAAEEAAKQAKTEKVEKAQQDAPAHP